MKIEDPEKSRGEIEKLSRRKTKNLFNRLFFKWKAPLLEKMKDVVSTLAHLISGSTDAGAPPVIVKGLIR